MPTPPPPRSRAPRILLTLVLGILGFFSIAPPGQEGPLTHASYDLLQLFSPDPPLRRSDSEVILVYLDLASHRELSQDPAGRWDRALHARLVDRLREARARAVVFDVLFDSPSPQPGADLAFAEAMRRHGRVFLAAEHHYSDQAAGRLPGIRAVGVEPPTEILRNAAAGWGVAALAIDSDFVVRRAYRRVDGTQPTLAWAAVGALGLREPDTGRTADHEWIHYYGPPLALPHVSYRSVVGASALDPSLFEGKVVFVGALPMVGVFQERRDELRSPLAARSEQREFMPGVELHATEFLNWARHEIWRRPTPLLERLLFALGGSLLGWLLPALKPMTGTIVAVAASAGAFALSLAIVTGMHFWTPWLAASLVLVPAAWSGSVLFHALEWGRQRLHLESLRRADARRIARQAALIDKARDLIVVTHLDGRIVYANPSAESMLTHLGADFPGAETLARHQASLLTHGAWSGILTFDQARNGPAYLESRWTLLRDAQGTPEAILMISTDLTEQRRLEMGFLRVQRWEAIGSLAGGMAHDLNNTLAPALLGLQILQRAESRPDVRRTLEMIETNTRRGVDTVRQVLRFLRGSAPEFEAVDPGNIVRSLEALIRDTFPRNIQVVALVPPSVHPVHGNAALLQQAVLNLCLNARDAMPQGGQLTLAVDDVELDAREAAQWPEAHPGAYVLVAVSDSGEGIPRDRLDRIFEPLFTTKGEGQGTGLGLSSVQRIVRQHGGFIAVTSDVGAGSTFELYLPRHGAPPVPALGTPTPG